MLNCYHYCIWGLMPLGVPGARHNGSPEMGNRVEIRCGRFNLIWMSAKQQIIFFYKQSHTIIGYTCAKKSQSSFIWNSDLTGCLFVCLIWPLKAGGISSLSRVTGSELDPTPHPPVPLCGPGLVFSEHVASGHQGKWGLEGDPVEMKSLPVSSGRPDRAGHTPARSGHQIPAGLASRSHPCSRPLLWSITLPKAGSVALTRWKKEGWVWCFGLQLLTLSLRVLPDSPRTASGILLSWSLCTGAPCS